MKCFAALSGYADGPGRRVAPASDGQGDWAIAAFDTPRSPSAHQHTGCHDIHHAAGGQFFVITSAGRAGIGS
ncbi:MAG: hypothetical protein J0H44_15160 [Alphaproteobacteria bacterium]|nr:hypothetical protein [Alphaproteobacteria bacterium]